jgi:hypothetical protein
MKHINKSSFLALILMGILIYSCQKEDDFLELQNRDSAMVNNLREVKKPENPYSVKKLNTLIFK